uniref:Phospholipid-transporting ATPase n=1 Tax=Ornithorhynchus anatinus TaxID=9258 RepID=A0A6I8P734_ORNAN
GWGVRWGSRCEEFTWEVKANDQAYHEQIKKKFFLCWKKRKYADNAIKTAKYNIFTFLPLNLYEQFHRMANLYFLFVILLQTIPEISTLPWFALLLPLACLLIIRGTRDLVDDIVSSEWIGGTGPTLRMAKKWRDIQVGDVVCLKKDDFVPADLLLLASSEPSSLCYVETIVFPPPAPPHALALCHGCFFSQQEVSFQWNEYADGKLLFQDPSLLEAIHQDADTVMREFWRLLALCHTVMVEEKDSQLIYQAASPDEEALVTAARNFGYVFLSRTQDTITTSELGVKRTYQVLAMLDFNSVRKRMSVLLRDPEGTIHLYTKGADTVIFERLQDDGPIEIATEKALGAFAEETLRTLCLASKKVEEKVYKEWKKRHHAASVLLQNRAQELDKVYEEIEQDLQLLGATAIEDKLQEGVPDTIHLLKKGNIKVWVLTGDKQETAVNIGYACRLLSDDMEVLEEKEIWMLLRAGEAKEKKKRSLGPLKRLQKCWAGWGWKQEQELGLGLEDDPETLRERAFVDLATQCQAVICCRVTPKQKAMIVQLVKKHKQAITLAIGDGANDINMIKTADIGVGISGQEGMQAVQSSDYALAQFSYLQRLLLVHGRWSYLRICKFLRYFFYKTFASMMVQIWFAFYSGFTAQPLYEAWFLALYNVFYTAYPVLSMGLLEKDMSAPKCLEFPEQYCVGQKDQLFNYWVFFVALVHGTATSLVNFYVTLWAFEDMAGLGGICDYQSFAVTVATSALLSVIVEIMMDIKFWTLLSALAITVSLLLFSLLSYVTQNFRAYRAAPSIFRFPCKSHREILRCHFLPPHFPLPAHLQKPQYWKTQKETNNVELRSHFCRNSLLRRSSYAFSHKEGYADLIARGASLHSSDCPAPLPESLCVCVGGWVGHGGDPWSLLHFPVGCSEAQKWQLLLFQPVASEGYSLSNTLWLFLLPPQRNHGSFLVSPESETFG